MAILQHPLHQGITVDTSTATQPNPDAPIWNYTATHTGEGGRPFELDGITVSPKALERDLGDDTSDAYISLAAALKASRQQYVSSSTGIVEKTIIPALTRTVGNIGGAPADLANVVLGGADAVINTARWAAGGFDEFPDNRILSSDPRDVIGGSAQISRGMQNVGDLAREGIRITEEAGLNTTIPWIGTEVGARTFLDPFAFNTTPDESTKTREYVSLITQIIGAAPVEGVLIAKLATQLAKTTKSPTADRVYEAMSSMQKSNPIRAAATETAMGAAAGAGMVISVEALEAAYPNAPEWMKNIVMAGGGLLLPIGAMTVGSTVWDVGLKTPIVRIPLRIAAGAMESLTLKGSEKAAARAVQTMGGDWKHRGEILGVTGQLKLALKEGRNMDEATRVAFTTPQLARNEARVLEVQLNAAADSMPSAAVAEQRQLIEELRRFANFQEGQLKTLSAEGGVGAEAYTKYSGRLMDRRDSIFAALDDAILKLDLGGRADDGVDASVIRTDYEQGLGTGTFEFNVNRTRAFQEGRLGTALDAEQTQAISRAYEGVLEKADAAGQQAIRDAEERVAAIRKGMPKDMSDQDRLDFNMWIRREIDTAYKEIDGYEDVLWNSIGGMNNPKTTSYVAPDGTDMGPQVLIDGVPIGEHFAAKAAALKGGEAESQSKWLWKLSGRTALIDEASKGGGPDAEKVAKQNVVIKHQEATVGLRQQDLDTASARLTELSGGTFESPALRTARVEMARLESELGAIPKGQTIEDTSVIRRINIAKVKLEGARAKVEALSKTPDVDPNQTKAQAAFEKAQGRLNEAQLTLATAKDNLEISLGKGVDFEGSQVDLTKEIFDDSALGVKTVDGVLVGRDAQELQNVISLLKAEISFEQGRSNPRPTKVAAIGGLIDDLQRAIGDTDNFNVDTVALGASRRFTATKKTLFERGVVGRLRGFNAKGEARVDIEQTITKIADPTNQETNLRQIETALTRVLSGEETPFQVVTREDGTTGPELRADANLERYAEGPPPPFESIDVNGGRSLGLKVSEGTTRIDANIEMVRNTLWDRFRVFGAGDEFNSSAASKWLEDNGAAIRWLKNATGKDTGFEDLVSAERVVQSIKGANARDLDATVNTLRKDGAFNEAFTEEGFRLIVKEAAKRESNLQSAATLLADPEPLTMGNKFIDKFLRNPETLGETLKILENGALPSGNNLALEGFKQAVAEALVHRALTKQGSGTIAAKEASRLTSSLDRTVRLWDPEAMVGLAQDPKIAKLLGELYGKDAPELFRKIAEGARLQSFVSDAATPGVQIKDAVSDEWAGNVGRVLGGLTAKVVPVSSLVLTGAGRRYSMNAIANVRGSAIDRLIVDFLMNPELAAAAIKKYPVVDPNANESLMKRARIWGHQKFIGDNARRIERLGKTPGTLFEIGAEALDMRESDIPENVGPQSAVQPAGPPPRRMAASVPQREVTPASMMSRVNPVGPAPAAPAQAGQTSQQTLAGLRELGMPLFVNQGGYIGGGDQQEQPGGIMSVRRKPRQMVG